MGSQLIPLVIFIAIGMLEVCSRHVRSSAGSKFVFSEVTNGTYSFLVNNKTWLTSSPTYFVSDHITLTVGKELKNNVTYVTSGHDAFGQWQTSRYSYSYNNKTYEAMEKNYPFLPIVIFYQHYVNHTTGTSTADPESVISAFPSFNIGKGQQTPLGYMSFGGSMTGGTEIKIGKWGTDDTVINGGVKGGPLILFDNEGNVMIIAPFNHFMSSSVYQDRAAKTVSWGIMGAVDSVPKNTKIGTMVMFSDKGINKALSEWGQYMRLWYKKDNSYRKSDHTINYLGYWTDNGAYYYYLTAPNMNYEETIMAIAKYGKQQNIPYRYVQYDSWFYPKGPNNGVTSWTAIPTIFPHGIQFVSNNISLPCAAHNRWWSNTTLYAKQNGGQYNFLIDSPKAVPTEERFWNDLLRESKKWGLIMYEQDWLDVEFMAKPFLTNFGLGRTWLLQMGRAAQSNDLTIQYCMSNPRHALQSLEISTVTQARVSGDYHPGNDQWKIGISSMFADALGLAPFKDTFWTTREQTGNKYDLEEPYPARQTVVSTLSTGPVGPSDKIGATNTSVLKKCCNANGLILKPSKPLTAINKQIHQRAFNDGSGPRGEVWTTHTEISGFYFGTIFAVTDASENYKLTPKDANFDGFTPGFVFRTSDEYGTEPTIFNEKNPLNLTGCEDFCLWHTSPVFRWHNAEILIYGEVGKWTPISPQRVTDIVRTSDIQIYLQGAEGEVVTFAFLKTENREKSFQTISCTLGPSGTAYISYGDNTCYLL